MPGKRFGRREEDKISSTPATNSRRGPMLLVRHIGKPELGHPIERLTIVDKGNGVCGSESLAFDILPPVTQLCAIHRRRNEHH